MKQIYNLVLTILTIIMLVFMTFYKLNVSGNWVDFSGYEEAINIVFNYGPMVLLCLFAFGSLFGRIMSKIFFILIAILLVIFSIAMFAPDVIAGLFTFGLFI